MKENDFVTGETRPFDQVSLTDKGLDLVREILPF